MITEKDLIDLGFEKNGSTYFLRNAQHLSCDIYESDNIFQCSFYIAPSDPFDTSIDFNIKTIEELKVLISIL